MTAETALPEAPVPDDVLVLDGDLGIEHVHALQQRLTAHIDVASPVMLDGGAVSRVHAAALQLLYAFCRDRHAAGRTVAWRHASETLSSAAALLGLNSELALPRGSE